MSKICYINFANISFALLQSSSYSFHISFSLFCQAPNIEMLSLNCNEKVTGETCGIQTAKLNLARHKKRCSAGTLFSFQCANFCTKV